MKLPPTCTVHGFSWPCVAAGVSVSRNDAAGTVGDLVSAQETADGKVELRGLREGPVEIVACGRPCVMPATAVFALAARH